MANDQVLRTGVLFKKGSGTGPFGRRNWKPRYFVLTPTKLSYYTYEDGELKGEINLQHCNENSIEVMPADAMKTGSSASTIWRIAINSNDRRLLVAAGTEMEMNDWVEQFRVAFSVNSGQPLPPQRSSFNHVQPVMGAIATTATTTSTSTTATMNGDYARNSITDFQNFAPARKSVTGGIRASMGVHGGHEFRLSDEYERQKQADAQRAAIEEERRREEEALQLHLRSQAEDRRRQKEAHEQEQDRQRLEELLEEQRRQKREQHERDRIEAERQLRELELQELAKREEAERHHHHHHQQHLHYEENPAARSHNPNRSPSSSPARSPTGPAPRSSVVTDAKREAMARQQIEHNKMREAAIKEAHEQKRREFLEQKKAQEDAARARHGTNKPASPVAPPRVAEEEQQRRSPPRSPPQPELQSMKSYEF